MVVHVKGPITWIGVYSKAMQASQKEVQPQDCFWQDSRNIPVEEQPPDLSDEEFQDVCAGKHMKQVQDSLRPNEEGEVVLLKVTTVRIVFST